MPPVLLCTPWITVEDTQRCSADAFPEGLFERALSAAQDMVHVALGYQYPGLCWDIVRACSPGCAQQWLAYPSDSIGGSRPIGGGRATATCGGSLCMVAEYVTLTNQPVVEVTKIVVDDAELPAGSWRIIDNRFVTPIPGEDWPVRGRTLELHYQWGAAVSEAIVMAAEVLACELAAGWSGGECRLPKRVTQVTAENISQVVLDPMNFLDDFGRFGIPEVDSVIKTFNPHGLDRQAKALSPAEYARRRNYRIR